MFRRIQQLLLWKCIHGRVDSEVFQSCKVLVFSGTVYPVHIIEAYIEVTVTAPLTPNLGTKWEWLISHPGHFTPQKNPSILWIGGWVGPRAGLNPMKTKSLAPNGIWTLGCLMCSLVTVLTVLLWLVFAPLPSNNLIWLHSLCTCHLWICNNLDSQ